MNKSLSPREVEVLEKLSHGQTTKEIASVLHLSCHTIISHKKNLCIKLGATNGPQLVRLGFQYGLLKIA